MWEKFPSKNGVESVFNELVIIPGDNYNERFDPQRGLDVLSLGTGPISRFQQTVSAIQLN